MGCRPTGGSGDAGRREGAQRSTAQRLAGQGRARPARLVIGSGSSSRCDGGLAMDSGSVVLLADGIGGAVGDDGTALMGEV